MKKSIKITVIVLAAVLVLSLGLNLIAGLTLITPGEKQAAEFGGKYRNAHSVIFHESAGIYDELDNGYHFSFAESSNYDETYISYLYDLGDFSSYYSPLYVTHDFNISLDHFENRMLPYMVFNDGTKTVGTTEIVTLYSDGEHTRVEMLDNGVVIKTRLYFDETLHFTYVYNFSEWKNGTVKPEVNVYINGSYFATLHPCKDTAVVKYSQFRFHIPKKYLKSRDGSYVITDVRFNYFERDYDGAIAELFDNHNIKLQDCTDSILYERG